MDIPTPESDAAEIVQTFKGLPDGRTGRVPLKVSQNLEQRLTVAREALINVSQTSSSTRLVKLAKEALDQTTPKQ